jgi:hypothetical protein
VLLAGAAMLISSFVRLSGQEAGFRSERVWGGELVCRQHNTLQRQTQLVSPSALLPNCKPPPKLKRSQSRTQSLYQVVTHSRPMLALTAIQFR